MVPGRCYMSDRTTNRNTLTKNEEKYKTAKPSHTEAAQKNTVDEPRFVICLRRQLNAKYGTERHVIIQPFLRKGNPQNIFFWWFLPAGVFKIF